jgi:large subunit ribosomal protein L20
MPRATNNPASRQRRKKVMKRAKGFFQGRGRLYRTASGAVWKALAYSYRDRRRKKRDFRALWITRIGAAARLHDLNYNQLIHGLSMAGVEIDRKALADLALQDAAAFGQIAEKAKSALAA